MHVWNSIIKLSESILLDYTTLQEESHEQEKLQDKKLSYSKRRVMPWNPWRVFYCLWAL